MTTLANGLLFIIPLISSIIVTQVNNKQGKANERFYIFDLLKILNIFSVVLSTYSLVTFMKTGVVQILDLGV
jgi:hypothetical protein